MWLDVFVSLGFLLFVKVVNYGWREVFKRSYLRQDVSQRHIKVFAVLGILYAKIILQIGRFFSLSVQYFLLQICF